MSNQKHPRISISPVKPSWHHWPLFTEFFCSPSKMLAFDLNENIFSPLCLSPHRYLSIFPGMIKSMNKHQALIYLCLNASNRIAGYIKVSLPSTSSDFGIMDFYFSTGCDPDRTSEIIKRTMKESFARFNKKIFFFSLSHDAAKLDLIKDMNMNLLKTIQRTHRLKGRMNDTLIFFSEPPQK